MMVVFDTPRVTGSSVAGVRIATEWDTVSHLGTEADPWSVQSLLQSIASLKASSQAAGGSIYAPLGIYSITQKVIADMDNFKLEGAGAGFVFGLAPVSAGFKGGTLFKASPTYNGDLFQFGTSAQQRSGLVLRDFAMDGNWLTTGTGGSYGDVGGRTSGDMMLFYAHTFADLRNIILYNCPAQGINIQPIGGTTASAFMFDSVSTVDTAQDAFHCILDESYFTNCRVFDYGRASGHAAYHGFHIMGNNHRTVLTSCYTKFGDGQDGFNIDQYLGLNFGVKVIGCIAENAGRFGFVVDHNAQNNSLLGCQAFGCVSAGFVLGPNTNTSVDFVNCDGTEGEGYAIQPYGFEMFSGTVTAFRMIDCRAGNNITANYLPVYSAQHQYKNNRGFNPLGILTTPFDNVGNAIYPGAGGALTSAKVYTIWSIPIDIYWTGGTVTAQAKNGTAIPQSATATNFIHLEPGDTYSITFTVTPTTFDVFGV